jgi:hypothetical protein
MASSAPLTPKRRWVSLTAATVVLQFAYWPIVASLVEGDAELAGLLWLGLAVTPFVFLVLAFASGHPRAPGATVLAMGLFLLVALPLVLVSIVPGLVAGFGAAAALALRYEPEMHSRRGRAIAVAGATLYVFALVLLRELVPVLGPFAIMSGAVIPLAVVGIADEVAESALERDREEQRG